MASNQHLEPILAKRARHLEAPAGTDFKLGLGRIGRPEDQIDAILQVWLDRSCKPFLLYV